MSDERELFKDTAWYYSRYRRGYPDSFFKHIVKTFNLDDTSHALDLGTGTGQIAIPLAPLVKEVVAIDPEQEMLDEGQRTAEEKGISNIKWIQSSAENICCCHAIPVSIDCRSKNTRNLFSINFVFMAFAAAASSCE